MKYSTHLFLILIISLSSCFQQHEDDAELNTLPKKYQVRSGTITYETILNTISVQMTYKTIVYFDNFGLKERRDTYDGDKLSDTFMSDGKNNYKIIYQKKEVYNTGKAYRGTEPKFGWEDMSDEDKNSDKVTKLPDTTIASKPCEAYMVKTNVVTSTFAGWKNILMLSEIKSAGGSSITRVVKLKTDRVAKNKFRIPDGYKKR